MNKKLLASELLKVAKLLVGNQPHGPAKGLYKIKDTFSTPMDENARSKSKRSFIDDYVTSSPSDIVNWAHDADLITEKQYQTWGDSPKRSDKREDIADLAERNLRNALGKFHDEVNG